LLGPVNVPDEPQALVTLDLPAGDYVLSGKVALSNQSAGVTGFADCHVDAETDSDGVPVFLDAATPGVAPFTVLVPFTVAHAFAPSGTASLICSDEGPRVPRAAGGAGSRRGRLTRFSDRSDLTYRAGSDDHGPASPARVK